jgi:hypothetical protein
MEKKTIFVQIVLNNKGQFNNENRYLSCLVYTDCEEKAKQIALDNYRHLYTGGEIGKYYVQCCWEKHIPTKKAYLSCLSEVFNNAKLSINRKNDFSDSDNYHYFDRYENTSEVSDDWKRIHVEWASEPVHYEPKNGCYVVSAHPYMSEQFPIKYFKGHTKEVYDEACKWVELNTFRKSYFPKYKI